jgi:hypothetical protein
MQKHSEIRLVSGRNVQGKSNSLITLQRLCQITEQHYPMKIRRATDLTERYNGMDYQSDG